MATREERKQRLVELLAEMHELMCVVHELFHQAVDIVDPTGDEFEQACEKLEETDFRIVRDEVPTQ